MTTENTLDITIPNTITVTIMLVIGFAVGGFLVMAFQKIKSAAMTGAAEKAA
jgi:hypothetical protein